VGGMMDDVVDQAEETIDEIVPRAGLMREAPLQEIAV